MEIMFDDLTYEAQKRLLEEAGVSSPEEMDWDTIPVAVVKFGAHGRNPHDDVLDEDILDETYDFDDDDAQY